MEVATSYDPSDPRSRAFALRHAIAAVALLVAFIALVAFAPPDDQTKVVSSLPCSILSERDVGSVVGAHVRLMPTNGTICHYVPTGTGGASAVFVVAHRDVSLPARVPAGGVALQASGHVYTIVVVPREAGRTATPADAQRLAKMVQHPVIAQNR